MSGLSKEELDAAWEDLMRAEREWNEAPSRLQVFHDGELCERMAWKEKIPEADFERAARYLFDKHGTSITLVWDVGPNAPEEPKG